MLQKCRFAWYNPGMENIFDEKNGFRSGPFGTTSQGEARLYTLSSDSICACLTDFGCTLTRLAVPDRNGEWRNVVLGYDSALGYERGSSFVGGTVGRYAGRIGGARFSLDGREYTLEKNDGENHLHGGFAKRFFDAERDGGAIRFSLVSPDMDEGFPGQLTLRVRVSVRGGTLRFEYEAETTAPTFVNITDHAYFDLGGGAAAHDLTVFADRYAETEDMIPTGRILPVAGTPLDMTSPRSLEETVASPELIKTRGLDHSFVLPKGRQGTLRRAALLKSRDSGISLLCRTTQPTVHVYTAGFLDLDAARDMASGAPLSRNGGVCLETQHLPDSPNKPGFPPTLLLPGEKYREITEYVFSA